MIRVLDFHDSVGAFGDRRARHDAPRLPLLESILAGVSRRNVARDGQSPRALTLEVLAAHRKSVHCGVRERREGDQRGNVDRQAATQTFLDGERLVGEDVAERQRLDQLAMLRGRQGGIVHVSKCRARWGGARRAGAGVLRVLWGCWSGGREWPSASRPLHEAWAGLGGCSSFQQPGHGCKGELQH